MRFYEFCLKYRVHAGASLPYMTFPFLKKELDWTREQLLWYIFINGNTQHPLTSWLIFKRFPDFENLDLSGLSDWYNKEWPRLEFDTDRRHQKRDFMKSVTRYKELCGKDQSVFFHTVTTEDDAVATGMLRDGLAQHQPELKAGSLPGQPHEPVLEVAVELVHPLLAVRGRRQRDPPVGVQVVDMGKGKEAVQRGIDGAGRWVERKDTVAEHIHHLIFNLRFSAALVSPVINRLQGGQLIQVQRGKIAAPGRAQIPAGSFNPQHIHCLPAEWIGFFYL